LECVSRERSDPPQPARPQPTALLSPSSNGAVGSGQAGCGGSQRISRERFDPPQPARPRPTAVLSPSSDGKPEAAIAVVVAPDDGHEDARNVLSCI